VLSALLKMDLLCLSIPPHGGETASTGIWKHRLHAERVCQLVTKAEINIIADDYNYALAA
jgi:hypothetical protein